MKTNVITIADSPGLTVQFTVDIELLNYLFADKPTDSKKKYTKAQAFYYLLQNQIESQRTYDDNNVRGSIETLSQNWNWHRQTVKNFVEQLRGKGILSLQKNPSGTVLHLNIKNAPIDT